ncbi:hypothetical protein NL526_27495, partial [Klebsiella pneumoniae]|nr:hypothetical protein [Klebsiella pneumoniae]
SRLEGISLLMIGVIFYFFAFRNNDEPRLEKVERDERLKYGLLLLLSMAILLVGSHFTVSSTMNIAKVLSINPIIIGMFIIGLGTTIPELLFS